MVVMNRRDSLSKRRTSPHQFSLDKFLLDMTWLMLLLDSDSIFQLGMLCISNQRWMVDMNRGDSSSKRPTGPYLLSLDMYPLDMRMH